MTGPPTAPTRRAVQHHVDLSARSQHLVTVTTEVPADVPGPVRLVMPTWTPGSYVMRDYVHHVQRLAVHDDTGAEVDVRPVGHTAWVVDRGGPLAVTIELYANEATVRTNHVDDDHALLVAPATFPAVEGCRDREHRVTFAGSGTVHGMLPVDDGAHVAADLDLLVDCAFEVEGATPFPTVRREVDGVPHTFVWTGPGPGPDPDETGEAMVAIAGALRDLLGGALPMASYTYLCTASPDRRGGGLEHRDGSVLQAAVDLLGTADGRARFWSLLAHEYAHLANVKRLVPAELVRPSLTAHVHTPSLWVAEGWTSYYEGVLSTRAGLWEPSRLLRDLGQRLDRARHRPGSRLQSVADASWTAWTKAYVADENSANAGNDYYGHGGLLAWCLDLLVRRHRPTSDGLDDAFRLLWATFGDTSERTPTTGYTPDDVVDAVSEAAGVDVSWFFDAHVTGTDFPPVEDLVEVVGLACTDTVDDDAVARLGIATTDDDHGVTIDAVERDGPAWQGGLTGGDRLLALDGLRVRPRRLDHVLGLHDPGDEVEVTVFRGSRLRTHRVRLAEPRARTRLRPVEDPSDVQRAAFHRWTAHDLPDRDA